MEVIIRSGIIVMGLLFIRKLAMGKISRKLQYYMWGILPIVLLIFPYFRIPAPALKENANQIRKAAQGEAYLKGFGLYNVRLRIHGGIARIETDTEGLSVLLSRRQDVISYLKDLGYTYITLDLEGFRSGSMDVGITG